MQSLSTQEIIQLQVGDSIAYSSRHGKYIVTTVKRISPTGQITTEENRRFTRYGNEIGGRAQLCSIAHAEEFNTNYDLGVQAKNLIYKISCEAQRLAEPRNHRLLSLDQLTELHTSLVELTEQFLPTGEA